MNEREQLKLQSYLDDELSTRERQEVARWLDESDDARVLLGELNAARSLLRGNEPTRQLDCTREFYWNSIERGILREESEPVTSGLVSLVALVRRYALQLGSAAAVIAVIAFSVVGMGRNPEVDSSWEVLDPNTAMINYTDFDNNITVVMLYDQSSPGFTLGD